MTDNPTYPIQPVDVRSTANRSVSTPLAWRRRIEEEVERFFGAMLSGCARPHCSLEGGDHDSHRKAVCGAPARKPGAPVEAIYDRAHEIIDTAGPEALTARGLAADLKISTRTLYKRIGNRADLIRAVAERYPRSALTTASTLVEG
ncbi:hypothetical protein [Mycobacterium sp. RTGN4]|nr:hypothetical protein [Mycobacterium sp. RTGN4]